MKSFLQKMKRSDIPVWIGIAVVVIVPYAIVNHLPMYRETMGFILGEQNIPFLPWTFVVYASLFVQYFVVMRRLHRSILREFGILMGGMMAVSVIAFLVFPIQFPRELYESQSWIVQLIRTIDGPGNCFPSLHVATSLFIAGCYASVEKTTWRRILMGLWAIVIALSVLTTKQHYLIDVFGGVGLAIPAIVIFYWFINSSAKAKIS